MTLYRVDVERERTATFFVEAADEEAAREDADVLASEIAEHEWDDSYEHVFVRETDETPQPSRWVWTGGPDGKAVPASGWKGAA